MKIVKIVILVTIVIESDTSSKIMKKHSDKKDLAYDECRNELGVGDDVARILFQARRSRTSDEHCFLTCAYTKIGWIQNGKILIDKIKPIICEYYRLVRADKFAKQYIKIVESCTNGVKKFSNEYYPELLRKVSKSPENNCSVGQYLRFCFDETMYTRQNNNAAWNGMIELFYDSRRKK